MDPVISVWWTSNGLLRIELDAATAQLLHDGLGVDEIDAPQEIRILSTMLGERLLKPQRRRGDVEA